MTIELALSVLGILLTLLLWSIGRRPARPSSAEINIALLGLRSSGKTKLIWTWSKAEVVRDQPTGATVAKTIYRVRRQDRIHNGRLIHQTYVFHDFGGEQPGAFIDEFVARTVSAIVVVVDHTPRDSGSVSIDQKRVDTTTGYIQGLVRGVLQSHRLSASCRIVLLFINKADLVSDSTRDSLAKTYSEAEAIIRGTGKTVKTFVGSAKEGWKVMDALAALDLALLPKSDNAE